MSVASVIEQLTKTPFEGPRDVGTFTRLVLSRCAFAFAPAAVSAAVDARFNFQPAASSVPTFYPPVPDRALVGVKVSIEVI